MIWPFKRKPKGEHRHVCVAVDSEGNRYTEHTFSFNDDDPWRGALILSQWKVDRLRLRGELPLTLVSTCESSGNDDI